MDTREKLIRIAHANPELRAKLLPLIKKEARGLDHWGRLPDPRRDLSQWVDSVLEIVNQSSQGFKQIADTSERATRAAPRRSPTQSRLEEAEKYFHMIAGALYKTKRSLEEVAGRLSEGNI